MAAETALTIGAFDGVHAGHAALVARAREAVGPAGVVKALAFFPHPLTKLAPERAPAVLTPLEEKKRLFARLGVDEFVVLAPDGDLLALPPEEFVAQIVRDHAPRCIVEGGDFRFGAKRAGSVETLRALSAQHAYDVISVPDVEIELADQSLVRASSTIARWLIANGRVDEAQRVLGRPFRFFGTAARGAQRGRSMGFRTANLVAQNIVPAEGVYAATAILPDGATRPAAVSVGTNPTFDGAHDAPVVVEAHVLDWDGDGAPEYGYPLALDFHEWLREQRVYSEVSPLIEQIERDVQQTRAVCAQIETAGSPA